MPEALRSQSEPSGPRWRRVTGLDSYAFGRAIAKSNWTYFALIDGLVSRAFGFDGERRVGAAVSRILAKTRNSHFNAVEITKVTSKRFFGLPYASVRAQSRHIQEGAYIHHSADFHSFLEVPAEVV